MKKKQVEDKAGLVILDNNVKQKVGKQDLTFENLDLHVDVNPYGIEIRSTTKWYKRLWYLISNPFYYLFKRYIRY
jgi:glutamine amidotransferase PdxT